MVRILGGTTKNGFLRVEGPGPELRHLLIVDHGPDIFPGDLFHLVNLMGGTETVEEMHEGDTGFQGSCLGDKGHIHDFLHAIGGKEAEARSPGGHDIAVIAEDGEGVGCHGTGGNVEHRGSKLSRDLEHVGDHQEKSLGGGEGGGESPRLKSTVNCSGSAAFALHFCYLGDGSPQVRPILGSPLIGPLPHGG